MFKRTHKTFANVHLLIYFNELMDLRIYNLSFHSHITHSLAVVAKKRKDFKYIFVLKRVNTVCRQQMTAIKLLQKHF